MGGAEPLRSEPEDRDGASIHKKVIFASNTGKCMEDGYPQGAVLLNVGSGDIKWPGWVSVDSHVGGWLKDTKPEVVCDIRKLPYANDYADAIAAIHVLEHFYYWDVPGVLEEWKRVLKPGARLILELPCMDKVFRLISLAIERQEPLSPVFSMLPIWGDPKYKDPAMLHKWGYFYSSLKVDLVKAGFTGVTLEKPRYHFPNRDMRVTSIKPLST